MEIIMPLFILGFIVLLGMYFNQIKIIKQNNRIIDLLEIIDIREERKDKK